MTPSVKELTIYPIKGCQGVSVSEIHIDPLGLSGDRRFLIVDDAGNQITQRSHPKLVSIAPRYHGSNLRISIGGRDAFAVPCAETDAPRVLVTVWSNSGLIAEDCGAEAGSLLSELLDQNVRLVRIGNAFNRPVKPGKGLPGDGVSFADAYPLLVASTASLRDLNDRLCEKGEEPVPMNRFRPNVVLENEIPFEEDTLGRFQIGEVVFRSAGPCGRCIVTTTDQATGVRGIEPLRTLAGYRRDATKPSEVNFGQNVINESKIGVLRLGDKIQNRL